MEALQRQINELMRRVEGLETQNPNSLVLISSQELAGSAATIDFQNIPSNFKHLRLVVYGRIDEAVSNRWLNVRLNNDSGANYDEQEIYSNAATSVASESPAQTVGKIGNVPGTSAPASVFDMTTIDIPAYAGATGQKVLTGTGSLKTGTATGGLFTIHRVVWWRSTAAITRITLSNSGAGNFVAGTIASLYGLTG